MYCDRIGTIENVLHITKEVKMEALLITASLVAHQLEVIIVKSYGDRKKSGGEFFNAIICFFTMLFFIVTDKGGFYFPAPLIIYGVLSCIGYAAGFYFTYLALRCGSYANTKMVSSLGTVLTVVYGTFFLGEPSGIITWLAVALIILAIAMMNSGKRLEGERAGGFSVKWLLFVLLSVAGNFVITVTKREQQIRFEGACDNEFLIISLFGAFLFLFIYGIFVDRHQLGTALKSGIFHGAVAGVCNGASNLLSIITLLYVPISVLSPINAGGGLLLAFLVSALLYKEKFTKRQMLSAVIGVVALVLFKIA